MKSPLISLIIVLPLLSFPVSLEVCAQDPTGALPGVRPTPTPTPTPKTPAARGSKSGPTAPVNLTLNLGEEKKGRLDPRNSDKNPDGSFYEEMTITMKSEDSLNFHIEGDNPLLGLQILDKGDVEVPVAKEPSGDFKIATPTGGAPADGEYKVRVTGVLIGKTAVPFLIKVDRLGLTSIAYNERFNKIYTGYNEKDPASVEATLAQLEELSKDNPTRSTAFELIGRIYLDTLRDPERAEPAMEQAIKTRGVALIRIAFDNQWRRMAKLRSGEYGFEEIRSGWLKIGQGQVTLTDLSNRMLASVNGMQIKELSKTMVSAYNLVTITADNSKKPYVFAPKNMAPAETDLVIKLIQNHVVGKAN